MTDTSNMIACRICGQVHVKPHLEPENVARCSRCGSRLEKRTAHSLHVTGALALAALILYVPANVFPIMRMEVYGAVSENTVWQGAQRLFQDGDYFIAVIVFLASMFIPLLKLLGLMFLVASAKFKTASGRRERTVVFRIIDGIGRWAMLDVFVLAILVSLVKLQKLATIIPGPGLFAFTCVVLLTMLATASFDPQLIWEDEEEELA